MDLENWVIGVDYGTDSIRSIISDAANGNKIASSIYFYPRWRKTNSVFII
jgi:L-ribulokinase